MNYETLSDAELSAAVAEKVAQWKPGQGEKDCQAAYERCFGAPWPAESMHPKYATGADAVLPLLEGAAGGHWSLWFSAPYHSDQPCRYRVTIHKALEPAKTIGTANTFARAACLALLKAHDASR
jgi:hypothetical protein